MNDENECGAISYVDVILTTVTRVSRASHVIEYIYSWSVFLFL